MTLNLLSLFAGIGGLLPDLGLERAGMRVVGQVEIDPYRRRVLAKHWPEVPRHDDVRTCPAWWAAAARPAVHVLCAGFPCQPSSLAGRRRGDADDRWLWPATADVLAALRPPWVVLENPPGLLSVRLPGRGGGVDGAAAGNRGAGAVLGDLAALGYDAQWDCIPASAVGAPHRRDRWWCLARLADADGEGQPQPGRGEPGVRGRAGDGGAGVADPAGPGRRPEAGVAVGGGGGPPSRLGPAQPAGRGGGLRFGDPWPAPRPDPWWDPQPGMGGAVAGVPVGVDGRGLAAPWERGVPRLAVRTPHGPARLAALGDAVVPQAAEHVGRIVVAMAGGVR